MTHRQYLAWQAWLAMQYDVPDRGDWYVMLLAALIDSLPARVWGKGGNRKLKPADYRLDLTGGGSNGQQKKGPRDAAEAAVIAKAKWFGMLDLDPKTFRRAEDIPGYRVNVVDALDGNSEGR